MQIELRHIHKRFSLVYANQDINLTFGAGRIIGILGENGAGKSTLMKILSGYQPMDSGEIWIDGARVNYHGPLAAIAHGIGMLQQDPLDVPPFTVLENFVYGSRMSWRDAEKRLNEISARFGFSLDPEMPTSQLSIGQRQQLEIVRLLALGVKTLILDEPTTGISAEQKDTLFKALRDLAKHDGLTVLLVSHKLEDVIALCNEVGVLRAGKVVGTLPMPVTTTQLVTLMFGQQLAPQTHPPYDLSAAKEALALENIFLRDKRITVENFSLRLKAGEIVGMAGLEGSGQELLLRACVGLVKPIHGRIAINGAEMTGKSYRQFMDCGVTFGAAGRLEEGLVAGLTLTEHMALVTDHKAFIDWKGAHNRTADQIQHYNVRGFPDSQIETLSGGNQQRLLMALMPEQPVFMALEQPTRGLDVDSARWIWEQLLQRRDKGTAILFSSPDLDELVAYSHRIVIFYAGRAVAVVDARQTNIDELGRFIGGHIQ